MFLPEPFILLSILILFCLTLEFFVYPKKENLPLPTGLMLQCLLVTSCYGWLLLTSGSPSFSAILTGCAALALVIASNLKWAVLGEPLVFSDLAVVSTALRHPKFYIFAIPGFIRLVIIIALSGIPAGFVWSLLQPCPVQIRLWAFFLACTSTLCLVKLPATRLAPAPDLNADLSRFGLSGCLFIYWQCWRRQRPACAPHAQPATPAFDLIVVVQCESFTDPQTLHLPPTLTLPCMPELARARRMASDYGELEVSGFGAYTIRTEYGVLFGRSEQELGFQKFDPFLTAHHEKAFSLPHKLGNAGFKSVFLHPYSLDFYKRRSLMSQIGFNSVLGAEAFPHSPTPEMPYVPDKALADKITSLCSSATDPLFLYAVTIENHGPWQEQGAPLTSYLEHLKNSDQMIGQLVKALDATQRSALLVFFGDHRPSISPDLSCHQARSTPYFIIPFSKAQARAHDDVKPHTLTPAQLHSLVTRYSLHPTV